MNDRIKMDKYYPLLQSFEAYTKDNRVKGYPILVKGFPSYQGRILNYLIISLKTVEDVGDQIMIRV
jgi:hypothetical protein